MSLFRFLNGKVSIRIIRGLQSTAERTLTAINFDTTDKYSKHFERIERRHHFSVFNTNHYPLFFSVPKKFLTTSSCSSVNDTFDNQKAIYIGGLNFAEYDSVTLKDLCQQFGSVESVRIQPSRDARKSYGFGFVIFSDKESAEKACLVRTIETPHGHLHMKRKTSSVKNEIQRTYVIHGCAHSIPIRKVYDYLNGLSEIELINRGSQGNNLFIVFKKECDHLLNELIDLNGLILTIERAIPSTRKQRRDRCFKVKLLGVPTTVDEMTIRNYFEKFGPIQGVYFGIDKRTGERNLFCHLHYTNQADAHSASHDFKHEIIDGIIIKAVSQGAVYE